MITGVGVDIVDVSRLISWANITDKRLRALFSKQEIDYCFLPAGKEKQQIAECLASRFAAKEAFYKALTSTLVTLNYNPENKFSFLFSAKHVSITQNKYGAPVINIDWPVFYKKIGQTLPNFLIHLSLSHEKNNAIAFVVISN